MAPDAKDAEVRKLQADVAQAEGALRREQQALAEANETLLRAQQEHSSWQQRVEELRNLREQQAAALHADAARVKEQAAACSAERQHLEEVNQKVMLLRQRLAQQPGAREVVEKAVAEVERDTQQRREENAKQWDAKFQDMGQKLEVAQARLAHLKSEKAERLKELLKWRRRMALLRIGRAGSAWKQQCQNELQQREADLQLLRLRKRLSRKKGHLDEEVALKAMEHKKKLDKEVAAADLRQEEREEDLEQLEEEVDALKERTAKAKELLRQHTQLNQALGICPARSASQRIRRLAEACAISESQAAKHARRDFTEASSGRLQRPQGPGPRVQGQLKEVEEDIQRSLRRSQSERRGREIQNELRRLFA